MAKTRAQATRAMKQEELRLKLQAAGHIGYINKCVNWFMELGDGNITVLANGQFIEDVGPDTDMQALRLRMEAVKEALHNHWRAVDKYLPALKSVEVTGDGGGPVELDDAQAAQRIVALLDLAGARRTERPAEPQALDASEGPAD